TPIVDRQDRLGFVDVGGDLGDRRGLLVSVHGAPVPVLCVAACRRGSLVAWMTLGSDGRWWRLLDDVTGAAGIDLDAGAHRRCDRDRTQVATFCDRRLGPD